MALENVIFVLDEKLPTIYDADITLFCWHNTKNT